MAERTDVGAGNAGSGANRRRLRVGIFDWLDNRRPEQMAALYEGRLRVVEYADALGFDYYQLAEHHQTPLCMAPSPSLFLAAAAQRTRRLRFAPMVYVLPLYHPVRLIEEICMLDHLSNGRLEIGIGRGVSPYEMAPWHVSVEEARPIFDEALEVLLEGLTTGRIDHEGPNYRLRDVEIVQRPLQQPYPPLWYPTNYSRSVPWIGRHGLHTMFGSLFPSLEATREQFEIYLREWQAHRDEPGALNGHVADPCYGISRHIYIAETDAQALAEAREALGAFDENFYYLWRRHGDERIHRAGWDELIAQGSVYVGSPTTVRERLRQALATCGANYFAGAFAFGSLTPEQSMRSMRLFAEEVLPALR